MVFDKNFKHPSNVILDIHTTILNDYVKDLNGLKIKSEF
jgi:hypothetical protein